MESKGAGEAEAAAVMKEEDEEEGQGKRGGGEERALGDADIKWCLAACLVSSAKLLQISGHSRQLNLLLSAAELLLLLLLPGPNRFSGARLAGLNLRWSEEDARLTCSSSL